MTITRIVHPDESLFQAHKEAHHHGAILQVSEETGQNMIAPTLLSGFHCIHVGITMSRRMADEH